MYAKIFTQIFDSSIVEHPEVRFTFMDLLVLADSDGVVDMTPEAISRRTKRDLAVITETIKALEQPDPRSRNTCDCKRPCAGNACNACNARNGARIVRLDLNRDWGWRIVNYEAYRNVEDEDSRRALTRERVRRYRQRQKELFSDVTLVTPCNAGNGIQKQKQKQSTSARGKASPKEKKPRPRNALFDELCRVFGMSPAGSNGSRIGKIATLLKDRGVVPEDIELAVQRYRAAWPTVNCTPNALEKHWDTFGPNGNGHATQKAKEPWEIEQERMLSLRDPK